MKKENNNKSGFTLIEILVVVLIIGLLTAITVPGYRKAVEKSKVADALTTIQAVAKSEHGFYLAKNTYTKDFADLDIALIDKDGNKADDDSFETVNYTFTLQNNNIKAQRANGEYTLYKMYDGNNIYCLPLGHYICEQFDWTMTKKACEEGIEGAWSNLKTNCYSTPKGRCVANNSIWQGDDDDGFCGVIGRYGENDPLEINEFEQCLATQWQSCQYLFTGEEAKCIGEVYESCVYATFTGKGAQCVSQNSKACSDSYFYENAECIPYSAGSCGGNTFSSGATCYGNYANTCGGSIIEDGGKCIGNVSMSCEGVTVNDGGECERKAGNSCTGSIYGTVIGNGGENGTRTKSYFHDGASCIEKVSGSCGAGRMGSYVIYEKGSRCISNVTDGCTGVTYQPGSCCEAREGSSCGWGTPKCGCTPHEEDGIMVYPTSC